MLTERFGPFDDDDPIILALAAAPAPATLDWQSVIEAAPDEESARMVYRLSQSDWFLAALAAAPTPEMLDRERLIVAISTVEWAWMENEGRFPAPSRDGYATRLRKQIAAMTDEEVVAGPLSNPKIAAEYARLSLTPTTPGEPRE